jgi:hypothetical protein
MNNRKRANGITLGILSILLGAIILIITFPKIILTSILIIGSLSALYYIGKALRNTIEDHLNEEDANNKWKQDRNIK